MSLSLQCCTRYVLIEGGRHGAPAGAPGPVPSYLRMSMLSRRCRAGASSFSPARPLTVVSHAPKYTSSGLTLPSASRSQSKLHHATRRSYDALTRLKSTELGPHKGSGCLLVVLRARLVVLRVDVLGTLGVRPGQDPLPLASSHRGECGVDTRLHLRREDEAVIVGRLLGGFLDDGPVQDLLDGLHLHVFALALSGRFDRHSRGPYGGIVHQLRRLSCCGFRRRLVDYPREPLVLLAPESDSRRPPLTALQHRMEALLPWSESVATP